jgi:redox-sensitive bicupin YhaK (pirin superfamily)
MQVRRTLPHRALRTIGAFCFVDHYGPAPTHGTGGHPMVVPPHPHTGLQTVSWLLSGVIDHRDSVGSVQRIRPGELNLMTSGHGIAHSEYSVGDVELHGVQLWVALPDLARHQEPHFEHHGDLPRIEADGFTACVVMGALLGEESKAATYSPLVCAELALAPGQHRIPVTPDFEHGVLSITGRVEVDRAAIARGSLHYVPLGRDALEMAVDTETTVLMIGGVPFDEELLMWWNFVGRSHDEIVNARADWAAGSPRFGSVVDDDQPSMGAPELPTVRLKPRPQRPDRR